MSAGPIWGTGVPRACPGGCHDRAVTVPLAIADACADTDTDCAAQTPPRVSVATSATYLSGASAPRATPSVAIGALRFDSQSKRSRNSHKVSIRWGNWSWLAQSLNGRRFEYRPTCEPVVESARVDNSVIVVLERPAGYLLGEPALLAEDRHSTGCSAQVDVGETH